MYAPQKNNSAKKSGFFGMVKNQKQNVDPNSKKLVKMSNTNDQGSSAVHDFESADRRVSGWIWGKRVPLKHSPSRRLAPAATSRLFCYLDVDLLLKKKRTPFYDLQS